MKTASTFAFAAVASVLVMGCGAEAPKKGSKTAAEIKKIEETSHNKQEAEKASQEPKAESKGDTKAKTEEKGKKDEKSK